MEEDRRECEKFIEDVVKVLIQRFKRLERLPDFTGPKPPDRIFVLAVSVLFRNSLMSRPTDWGDLTQAAGEEIKEQLELVRRLRRGSWRDAGFIRFNRGHYFFLAEDFLDFLIDLFDGNSGGEPSPLAVFQNRLGSEIQHQHSPCDDDDAEPDFSFMDFN